MEDADNLLGSPETFLTALSDRLSSMSGADKSLADILKTHLLRADPPQDAVKRAMLAISKLASERATPKVQDQDIDD